MLLLCVLGGARWPCVLELPTRVQSWAQAGAGVQGSKGRALPDCVPLFFQLDPGTRSSKPAGPGPATGHREAGRGEAGPGSGAGPVLQFFTRLRRHASLDGASPYFKVKKWKLDPSQRASSLDTRGELGPLAETGAQGVQLPLLPQAAFK